MPKYETKDDIKKKWRLFWSCMQNTTVFLVKSHPEPFDGFLCVTARRKCMSALNLPLSKHVNLAKQD